MCQSAEQGGRRCAGHTRARLSLAVAARERAEAAEAAARADAAGDPFRPGLGKAILLADAARKAEADAEAAHAATPAGGAELDERIAAADAAGRERLERVRDRAAVLRSFEAPQRPAGGSQYVLDVSFTASRPVVPDEMTSRVVVMADSESEAHLVASLMVIRPAAPHLGLSDGVQMPTRSVVVDIPAL